MTSFYNEGQKLGYHFREFLDLTQQANLTLKTEPNPVSGGLQEDIRFNYFERSDKYKKSLAVSFKLASEEIEVALFQNYERAKKLDFITRHLTELELTAKMLSKNTGGVVEHSEFSFIDISDDEIFKIKTLGNIDAQEFLKALDMYNFKFKYFLEGLRDNVKASNQVDFPLPPNMITDPNEATKENPLCRFEFLICNSGIIQLRNSFKPSEEDYDGYEHLSYDPNTETKTFGDIDPLTGEWETYTQKFSDVLLNQLSKEFLKCKTLIDQHVNGLLNEEATVFFFKLTLDKLRYLLGTYDRTTSLLKYTDVLKPIRGLIKYCYEKYKSFCPNPEDDELLSACLKDSKLYQLKESPAILQISAPRPGVFLWKDPASAARLTTVLHDGLNTIFIDNVELTIFSQAFDGGNPPSALGFKWIDKPKSGSVVNKVTLLYLFKLLEDKGLLDCQYGSAVFLRKIEYIFKDPKGKALSNWPQSLKSVKEGKLTPQKKMIDELVSKMADGKTL
ncbi:hypothetical protein [Mucilaginibacter sp. PAMB04168]|uniref:hypothetical protein n=1 Tax=Mucilaginibacter sp. PAMB04168 TaxID=3138567 RepID=UPI0031F61A1E